MAFALLFFGSLFLVSGVRGTNQELGSLLQGDFTGKGNFFYWLIAVVVLGSLGYIPSLQRLSRAFLMLVLVVLFISNKGFFKQFNDALASASGTGAKA